MATVTFSTGDEVAPRTYVIRRNEALAGLTGKVDEVGRTIGTHALQYTVAWSDGKLRTHSASHLRLLRAAAPGANVRQQRTEYFAEVARQLGWGEVSVEHRDDVSILKVVDHDGKQWYSSPTYIHAYWRDGRHWDKEAMEFRSRSTSASFSYGNLTRYTSVKKYNIKRVIRGERDLRTVLSIHAPFKRSTEEEK